VVAVAMKQRPPLATLRSSPYRLTLAQFAHSYSCVNSIRKNQVHITTIMSSSAKDQEKKTHKLALKGASRASLLISSCQ